MNLECIDINIQFLCFFLLALFIKGIVHFEIHFWYVSAYLKGIQDVGVFVSAVNSILVFLNISNLMEAYGHHLKEHAQRSL